MCWWSVRYQRTMQTLMLVVLCEILLCIPNTWFCYCKIFPVVYVASRHFVILFIFLYVNLCSCADQRKLFNKMYSLIELKEQFPKTKFGCFEYLCYLLLIAWHCVTFLLLTTGFNGSHFTWRSVNLNFIVICLLVNLVFNVIISSLHPSMG